MAAKTKQERLQELKSEEQLYKVLDKYFDAGWREFVKGVRKENTEANEMIYKDLIKIRGQEFADDVRGLLKDIKEQFALLEIVKVPVGMEFNDSRYPTIPKIWVQQKSGSLYSGDSTKGATGSLCIQVNENYWIKIDYTLLK